MPYNHWKIDRKIPVTVIMALLLQAGGAIMWATQLDARMAIVERSNAQQADIQEKWGRLDERLDHLRQDMQDIKMQINHLNNKLLDE